MCQTAITEIRLELNQLPQVKVQENYGIYRLEHLCIMLMNLLALHNFVLEIRLVNVSISSSLCSMQYLLCFVQCNNIVHAVLLQSVT